MKPTVSHLRSTQPGMSVQQIQTTVKQATGVTFALHNMECIPNTGMLRYVANMQVCDKINGLYIGFEHDIHCCLIDLNIMFLFDDYSHS